MINYKITRQYKIFSHLSANPHQNYTMGQTTELLTLIMLIITLPICLHSHPTIRVRESERRTECRGCTNQCDKCEYGVTISPGCGVLECRKGPDEHCGDHNKGVCGDGMICLCERCIGCSIDTLECSDPNLDHPCLPAPLHHGDNHDSRYMDSNHNNRFLL